MSEFNHPKYVSDSLARIKAATEAAKPAADAARQMVKDARHVERGLLDLIRKALDSGQLDADDAVAMLPLVAPFDGVIADAPIRAGQYVNAGTPLVMIGAAPLHIETTDLSEKDVAGIAIGSKAQVSFDALPGVKADGTVSQIAPKSSKTTGVNYTVTIELGEIPAGLRWGMTALVEVAR